ncbi:MAG: hypothetical protein EKK53_02160 [Burkholderiales bacterium]|nr:MAG: hypothetical protein EKK53_02160 [Burkholderiales bacterium]
MSAHLRLGEVMRRLAEEMAETLNCRPTPYIAERKVRKICVFKGSEWLGNPARLRSGRAAR